MQQYYFFRHGKADPMFEDLYKPLTSEGIRKVKAQAKKLTPIAFDLVICSAALRTQQTANLLLGSSRPPRLLSENLWHPQDPTLREQIDTLVATVAGSCPADFTAQDPNQYYETYAKIICNEITAAIKEHSAKTILIVGHAIILNAIAGLLAPLHKEFLSALKLGTAEGFSFTVGNTTKPLLFLL
jgi:broad specificity phosphatase PhoE